MKKTLRIKIILPVMGLVTAIQLVSGYFVVSRVDQAMHHENHRRGLAVAFDLAHGSARALVSRDLAELRTFIRYAMSQEYVTQAMILDQDCRILMHNNLARVGEAYQDSCPQDLPEFGGHYIDEKKDLMVDIRVPIALDDAVLGTAVLSYSHMGITRELNSLRNNIFFIMLLGSLIAMAFAFLLAEYITRPIKHLSLAAEELGGGRFEIEQMAEEYSDELGELAKAFYAMAGKLEKEVCHDTLTGLYTRSVFQMRLIEAGSHSLRHNCPLAILMLDVDFFKRVNDTHGHMSGDTVLRQIAGILGSQTRAGDCVARYGGEEFVVLLPDTKRRGAMHVAEKIRRGVESHPFRLKDKNILSLTISVGVAVFPEDTTDYKWLLELADQALYEAKKGGRNQVVQASSLLKNIPPPPA